MKNSDCAIVIMSCDSYSDLWEDFFKLKKKNWPDCPFTTYLVTNCKKVNSYEANVILCGNHLNWTGRLNKCLNEIPEQTLILLLDDYYIADTINTSKVKEILSLINNSNVSYYKFPYGIYIKKQHEKYKVKFKNYSHIRVITPNIRYGVTLAPSIWKKDFLQEIIKDEDYTPWEFEIKRNNENDITKNTDKLLLCDTRNVLNIVNVVQRGKYLRKSLQEIKKYGYNIKTNNRAVHGPFFEPYTYIMIKIRSINFLKNIALKIIHLFNIKTISEQYEEEIKKDMYK